MKLPKPKKAKMHYVVAEKCGSGMSMNGYGCTYFKAYAVDVLGNRKEIVNDINPRGWKSEVLRQEPREIALLNNVRMYINWKGNSENDYEEVDYEKYKN